ncbi:MAG: hypothetical protein AAFR93_17790, partial [Pseudomonadota bacterium]
MPTTPRAAMAKMRELVIAVSTAPTMIKSASATLLSVTSDRSIASGHAPLSTIVPPKATKIVVKVAKMYWRKTPVWITRVCQAATALRPTKKRS